MTGFGHSWVRFSCLVLLSSPLPWLEGFLCVPSVLEWVLALENAFSLPCSCITAPGLPLA